VHSAFAIEWQVLEVSLIVALLVALLVVYLSVACSSQYILDLTLANWYTSAYKFKYS